MTGEEQEQQTSEQELQARYHASLVKEIKRLNTHYNNIEEMDIQVLETIKEMELEKLKKANEQPKPTFQTIKKGQPQPDAKEVKNEAPTQLKFNRLQIFHPQFTPVENMHKYKENCTIFTMMINPDPRFPEWQVS